MRYAIIMMIAVVLLVNIVGNMSLDDETAQESHYCEMVNSGAWGAYKNIDCTKQVTSND